MDALMALSYFRLLDCAGRRAMTQGKDWRDDLPMQWMQQNDFRDSVPLVHGLSGFAIVRNHFTTPHPAGSLVLPRFPVPV